MPDYLPRSDGEFDGVQAGQIAHYMLRWVNGRGEKGPWSQTVSATVGA